MCEYCGCQALASVEELTREHTEALELIALGHAACRKGDGGAAVGVAERLLALLEPHTAVEEQALFPAMAREHPEHVAILQGEHEQVHRALSDFAAGATAPDWAGGLGTTLHLLREHIFKEQNGLFPAALVELRTADWERVEAVRRDVGSTLAPTAR